MSDRPLFLIHASVAVMRDDQILLVQEEKQDCRGQWNLPGGHVDLGEPPLLAAQRELREETGLDLQMDGLLGIYQGPRSLRFVFRAIANNQIPTAGDEILAVRFVPLTETLQIPDEQLTSPATLRAIVRDLRSRNTYPLDVLRKS